MKTKTIKTPLMMAEAFGLTCCPSALVRKSKLLHCSEAHHGFILKLSHHEWKNPALRAEKPTKQMELFFSERSECGFSSVDVFSCEATSGDVVVCAGACSQAQSHDIGTQARRAKDISRGVFEVFVYKRN